MDEQDSGVWQLSNHPACATLQLSLSDEFKLYYSLRGPIKKARRADDLMTTHKCTFFHMFKSRGR